MLRFPRIVSVAALSACSASAGCTSAPPEKQSGSVYSFGSGQYGETGLGIEKDTSVPTKIPSLKNVTFIATSGSSSTSAVLGENGGVSVFGQQLGPGSPQDTPTPIPRGIPPGTAIKALAVGEFQGFALTAEGALWAWGKRATGTGSAGVVANPQQVKLSTPSPVSQVSCGREHTLVLTENGEVWACGSSASFATGFGSKEDVHSFKRVTAIEQALGGARVTAIAAGRDHSLVLDSNGEVWAFGDDSSGQCGSGETHRYIKTPTRVEGIPHNLKVVAISAGAQHSAAITCDNSVFTWGSGSSGALGHGDRTDIAVARRVEFDFGGKIVAVAAGGGHTLFLTDKQQLFAAGKGRNGQLGRGSELESMAAYRTTPVLVTTLSPPPNGSRIAQLAAGRDHILVLV
jgi:alpha-tubulin suppressor-like RCC1 family protein